MLTSDMLGALRKETLGSSKEGPEDSRDLYSLIPFLMRAEKFILDDGIFQGSLCLVFNKREVICRIFPLPHVHPRLRYSHHEFSEQSQFPDTSVNSYWAAESWSWGPRDTCICRFVGGKILFPPIISSPTLIFQSIFFVSFVFKKTLTS